MIQADATTAAVPGVVVGVGSEVPERTDPGRFRNKFKMTRPFAIYIGRIDENKGCTELFSHFFRYAEAFPRDPCRSVQYVSYGELLVRTTHGGPFRYQISPHTRLRITVCEGYVSAKGVAVILVSHAEHTP